MKTITHLPAALLVLSSVIANAQTISSSPIDSLASFNNTLWTNFYNSHHSSTSELSEFIKSHQRDYIKETYFPSSLRLNGVNPTPQLACTNIDFENGSLSGWTSTTGYNPIYNPAGCCITAGGAQVITSGAGVDPCGGFPVVAPGGSFSIKLGDNNTGGRADRIEQTFFVTPLNANFMYRYAVVFQDPGHSVIDQPSFQAEMVDSLGNQIPCTYYNVSAGAGIPGFLNSTGCAGVVYKPWSNVSVDLTSYIGQNVTIRFTTQDCALGGHYAYAYIDGSCSNFNINQSNILCQGTNTNWANNYNESSRSLCFNNDYNNRMPRPNFNLYVGRVSKTKFKFYTYTSYAMFNKHYTNQYQHNTIWVNSIYKLEFW